MFKSSYIAAIGAAVVLAGFGVAPAAAQTAPRSGEAQPAAESAPTGRIRRQNRNARPAAPAAPTPEENLAAAQTLATSAGLTCQATEASLLPLLAGESRVYEAACASGPGYILIASTPPQSFDCVLLAATQARLAAANAATPGAAAAPAAAGTTEIRCTLPRNTDVMRVMVEYAREANLPCVPDEGGPLSKQIDGDELYEIGCEGQDGYLLQKQAAGGFKATECVRIIEAAIACQFSTSAEQAATLKARFAGNAEAAACDVTRARYMGANANGSFYEAKCAADNGVIVRFNNDFAVQQVYPCEVAQRIGGGCTMTIVPPLPEGTVSAPAQ
ncbi:hypothetical protein [Brevundimonas sp. R86498]|uniref:hypothetical protein n=1 Tax=Brevundimonas sp. R86498 TaxID=3093845 RepID=UPI0037C5993D